MPEFQHENQQKRQLRVNPILILYITNLTSTFLPTGLLYSGCNLQEWNFYGSQIVATQPNISGNKIDTSFFFFFRNFIQSKSFCFGEEYFFLLFSWTSSHEINCQVKSIYYIGFKTSNFSNSLCLLDPYCSKHMGIHYHINVQDKANL